MAINKHLKYAFEVNPQAMITIARSWNNDKKYERALDLLDALGVPTEMKWDIIHGHIDFIKDHGNWSLIDHRETKRVLERLKERS